MRACSSPASWRRPATRTPPRRCTGALSTGRRRRGRTKFALLFVVLAGSPGRRLRGVARLAAARGDDDAADNLQARAAAMAERDRASPDALQGAAVAT